MPIVFRTTLINDDDIKSLYDELGWHPFSKEQLLKAMAKSWYVIYAYEERQLVGTGRIVSDGAINAYLCGLGVLLNYRNQGIGKEISMRLIEGCKAQGLYVQFFCEGHLVPFYKNMGCDVFAVGMKYSGGCI